MYVVCIFSFNQVRFNLFASFFPSMCLHLFVHRVWVRFFHSFPFNSLPSIIIIILYFGFQCDEMKKMLRYESFVQQINLSSWRLRFKWLTLNWINILRRYREKIHATITIMSCRHQQQRQRWWQWSNWKVCWMCVFVCSVHTFLFGLRPFPLRLSRFLLTKYVY